MDLDEGATRDRDPEKIAVTGGGGRALARRDVGEWKERGRAPRVSEGEREGSERATEAKAARASGAGASRLGRCWAAASLAGLSAWLARGLFPFF